MIDRLRRRATLATRLTAWYVGILAVMLALLATFLYAALARALEQSTFAQLRGDARDVRWAFERAVLAGTPPPQAADRALADATTPGAGVMLLGPDGAVLARSRLLRDRPPELPATAAAALRDGRPEWSGVVEDADASGQVAILVVRLLDPPPPLALRAGAVERAAAPPPGPDVLYQRLPADSAQQLERRTSARPAPGHALTLPSPRGRGAPAEPPGEDGAPSAVRALPDATDTVPAASPLPLGEGQGEGVPDEGGGRPADDVRAGALAVDGVGTWTAAAPVPGQLADRLQVVAAPAPGLVQISVSLSPVQATLRTMRAVLAGGVLATLALAALAGRPLTGFGLRPLRAVAGASRRLADGDLSVRVEPPAGDDEIGELAQAFNHMAERLEAGFAAQRSFVADASHELRTPLTALGGQLDVLLRAAREDPEAAERLARAMRREVSRASRLVEDLLVLARLDAQGARALRVARVDLVAVGKDVFEELRALPLARGRAISLVAERSVPVLGDASRLHQALLNLAVNALQHGAPAAGQGTVVLRVEAAGRRARATVQDDGPGIPPEHLARLFDRFYRVEAARTRPADGGAGIGLAIARAIVDAHGGAVAAANRPRGGALFTIELPLDDSQPILNPATEPAKLDAPR